MTYKQFIRELRKCREHFQLIRCATVLDIFEYGEPMQIIDQRKAVAIFHVERAAIPSLGQSRILRTPLQVVHRRLTGDARWSCDVWCGTKLGMVPEQARQVHLASLELPSHILSLRRRILKACRLREPRHDY
jgi:hypothetical protein